MTEIRLFLDSKTYSMLKEAKGNATWTNFFVECYLCFKEKHYIEE